MAGRDVGEDHGVCTARIIYGTAVFETGIIAVTVKDRSESAAFATDGAYLYVAPEWLIGIFEKNAQYLDRAYLHTVLHCIFPICGSAGTGTGKRGI